MSEMPKRKYVPAWRLLTAALSLCLCLCLLPGCGLVWIDEREDRTVPPETAAPAVPQDTSAPQTSPAPEIYDDFPSRQEEARQALGELFDKDLSDSDFLAVIPDNVRDVLFGDGGDPMQSTYLSRNEMVREKYGCDMVYVRVPADELPAALGAAVKSGDYYGDVLVLPARNSGSLGVSGLLMDLRRLSYYEPVSAGSAGAGAYVKVSGKTVTVSNFFDISPAADAAGSVGALFFNRSAAGQAGSDLLYRAALNGRLTFEYLLKYIAEYGSSAEAALSVGADAADAALLGEIAAVRSGLDLVSPADGAYPALALGTDENLTAALSDTIVSLSAVSRFVPEAPGPDGTVLQTPYDAFASGKTLFRVGTLSEIWGGLHAEKTEWGLLELPVAAWSDGDAAENWCAADRPVFCVPAGNSARIDLDALILTALGTASRDWLRDQLAALCVEQYLRDNSSYFTLRRILDREDYCDFSVIYGDACPGLYDATLGALRLCFEKGTAVGETVKTLRDQVNKNLKNVYK